MAKQSARKALKHLRSVTEKALASRQIEHAAQEAVVDKVGRGAIKKMVRRAARTVAADIAKAATKSAKKRAAKVSPETQP